MVIRAFHPADLDALIQIAQASFAEEFTARGETPDGFAQQVRMATRGRMIPFKLLSFLAGYQWELYVAEVNGIVVGCGGFIGRKKMELANLMVHPQYRRQGIGQSLLEKRLQRLTELGHPLVTTTILATNQASLGNVRKQGFEIYDQYKVLETTLPLAAPERFTEEEILVRPIQQSDEPVYKDLEAHIATPLWLEINGSASNSYFLTFADRLINRLTGTKHWAGVLTKQGQPVGFLAAATSGNQTTGGIARPVIADRDLLHLPTMLQYPATWLAQLGKQTMQIAVPDARHDLVEDLKHREWRIVHEWVQLVKYL
jgi:ribosomal protein S18 acetylase RimI-like enzyme